MQAAKSIVSGPAWLESLLVFFYKSHPYFAVSHLSECVGSATGIGPFPPTFLINLRFLALVALEPTHFSCVDLVHVDVWGDHQLILTDAAEAGGGRGSFMKRNDKTSRFRHQKDSRSVKQAVPQRREQQY